MATPTPSVSSENYDYEWTVNTRQQVTCWCFTLNNYTDDECSQLRTFGESGDIKYFIAGKEVGEQGTPHLQCFVQLCTKKTFGGLKRLLPPRVANVKPMYRRSTPYACFKYCSKDNDFIEYGERPQPNGVPGRTRQKEDYAVALQLARDDKLDELDPGLFLRYYRTFHSIRDSAPKQVKNLDGCCGLWVVGPPGSGKSTWVRNKFGDDIFDKSLTKWWCKYRGQRVVLLDDVDRQHKDWIGHFLKRWADKFPFPAEVKSSQVSGQDGLIRPGLIVVTSNYTIVELFASVDALLCQAIMDRFKMITMDRPRTEPRSHVLEGIDLDPYSQ